MLIMGMISTGAVAALFMGLCMGATLRPAQPVAARIQQAPRLVVDPANTGLLASAALIRTSAG